MGSAAVNPLSHAQAQARESRSGNSTSSGTQATSQAAQQLPSRQRPTPLHSSSVHDASSDDATSAFIRRTLCPQHPRLKPYSLGSSDTPPPIHELLPPLTSSNEIDVQLYALIAIILREFVQTWYNVITPDTSFVDEVIHTIAHCTRALEERIRHVDMQELLLHEIPMLVDAHVRAVRIAQQARSTTDPHLVYQALRPHPAFSDRQESHVQQEAGDAAYRRLLAQGLLAVLLPVEDVQNPCLFALVSEILGDMILGEFVAGRTCEGAFIYDIIKTACDTAQKRFGTSPWAVNATAIPKSQSRLLQFGLVSDWDAQTKPGSAVSRLTDVLGTVLQAFTALVSALRTMFFVLQSAEFLPRRTSSAVSEATPILTLPLWTIVAFLFRLDEKMPWLTGIASLLQWVVLEGPGCIARTNGRLDRLLARTLFSPFEDPESIITDSLRTARTTLFPGNALPVVPPLADASSQSSPAQDQHFTTAVKKRTAAVALLNLVPRPVARILFTASASLDTVREPSAPVSQSATASDQRAAAELEAMVDAAEDVLGIFDNSQWNRCLMYSVIEALVARAIPELAAPGKCIANTEVVSSSTGGSIRDLLEAKGVGGVVAQAELDELSSLV